MAIMTLVSLVTLVSACIEFHYQLIFAVSLLMDFRILFVHYVSETSSTMFLLMLSSLPIVFLLVHHPSSLALVLSYDLLSELTQQPF